MRIEDGELEIEAEVVLRVTHRRPGDIMSRHVDRKIPLSEANLGWGRDDLPVADPGCVDEVDIVFAVRDQLELVGHRLRDGADRYVAVLTRGLVRNWRRGVNEP